MPQRAITPCVPRPLVIAIVSIMSFWFTTVSIVTSFSKSEYAKSTLAAESPPLTCTSIRWHLRALRPTLRGCVCARTRTTAACFFSDASWSLISCWPFSYFCAYLRAPCVPLSGVALD